MQCFWFISAGCQVNRQSKYILVVAGGAGGAKICSYLWWQNGAKTLPQKYHTYFWQQQYVPCQTRRECAFARLDSTEICPPPPSYASSASHSPNALNCVNIWVNSRASAAASAEPRTSSLSAGEELRGLHEAPTAAAVAVAAETNSEDHGKETTKETSGDVSEGTELNHIDTDVVQLILQSKSSIWDPKRLKPISSPWDWDSCSPPEWVLTAVWCCFVMIRAI